MKKLTIEFIRAEFAKEGYELLTTTYENNQQKLEYICPKGHKHFITWGNWGQRKRCSYCVGNAKLSIEFIRAEFKREGYTLLTTIYKNAQQKLDYICPKDHRHSITWGNWQQGQRCPCFSKYKNKLTIEFIRAEFKKEGYELLTKTYRNNTQKLKYICPRGHRHSVTWHGWQYGHRCPCFSNLMRPTIEFIRSEFAKEGYTLLTKVYKNNSQRLNYICPRGHKYRISWSNWGQGKRCPCFANRPPITIDFVRKKFEKRGYILLSTEYNNARSRLKFKCDRGHIGSITWDNFSHGAICLACSIEDNAGPGHQNWQGGISKEPYCQNWTKKLKESIKKRDGYRCINPYCFQKEGYSSQLTIHHIDYNKKNCDPRNLITVCRSCNCRANIDREFHKAWYQVIMYKRYDYKY